METSPMFKASLFLRLQNRHHSTKEFLGTKKDNDGKLSLILMVKKVNIILKINLMLSGQEIEFIKKWEVLHKILKFVRYQINK